MTSEAESKDTGAQWKPEFHTMCPAVSHGLQGAGAPWHWSIGANMGWMPLREVKDRRRPRRHFCFARFHILIDVNSQERGVRTHCSPDKKGGTEIGMLPANR